MTHRAFLTAALLATAALLTGLPAAPPEAAARSTVRQQFNPNFAVLNRSGATIWKIQIAHGTPVEEAPDLLGRQVLADGRQFEVRPPVTSQERPCLYDLRISWSPGSRVEVLRNQNVCAIDVLTLEPASRTAQAGSVEVVDHSPSADVDIRNNGPSPIVTIGASAPRESTYAVRRPASPIGVGERFRLEFPRDGECIYDLQIQFADGRVEELAFQDLCAVSELVFPHPDSQLRNAAAN
jgi:hypothetical protein